MHRDNSRQAQQLRHEESEQHYKAYISNIGWRHKFTVTHEEDAEGERVVKIDESGQRTVLSTSQEFPNNTLYFQAWKVLKTEFQWNGVCTFTIPK